MITFTFVKKREGWTDEAFFERWAEHTRDFDLVDHPYITKNRLLLIQGPTPYVGIAENHWPDPERGRAPWADLQSFLDIEGSPTVVVGREVDVGPEGILQLFPPVESAG